MKTPACLVFALLGLSACTTTRLTEPNTRESTRIALLGQRHPATVEFSSGERIQARLVTLDGDPLRWFDADADANYAAAAAEVKKIMFHRTGAGGLQGLGLGFLLGAGIGALMVLSEGDDPSCAGWGCLRYFEFSAGEKAIVYGTLLGTAGGALGGLIGLGNGRRDHFELQPVPPAGSVSPTTARNP